MSYAFFNTLISESRKSISPKFRTHIFGYLIESKVQSQRSNVSRLAAAANVSQLQLEVVPAAVGNVHLIQTQTHQSCSPAGHGKHQLPVYHLEEKKNTDNERIKGRTRKAKRTEKTMNKIRTFSRT